MRENRSEERSLGQIPEVPFVAAETLRNSTSPGEALAPAKIEERIPLFLRVFGGTLLSIMALGVITVCQYFNNSLTAMRGDLVHLSEDFRKELSRLAESQGDLVKKDEFNARMKAVWESSKDIKADMVTLTALKERCAMMEERLKAEEDNHKSLVRAIQEREVKTSEEERKDLLRELLHFRERLAVIEGHQGSAAGVKSAVHREDSSAK